MQPECAEYYTEYQSTRMSSTPECAEYYTEYQSTRMSSTPECAEYFTEYQSTRMSSNQPRIGYQKAKNEQNTRYEEIVKADGNLQHKELEALRQRVEQMELKNKK